MAKTSSFGQSVDQPRKYVKRQQLLAGAPVAVQRFEASAQTRILSFPWGTNVGWPLREIGVVTAGIDRLQGRFKAGTPCSPTHLLYFVVDGEVSAASERPAFVLRRSEWAVFPAGCPHWIQHRKGRAEAIWVHLLDIPRWSELKASGPQARPIHSLEPLHHTLLRAIEEAEGRQFGSYENAMAYTAIFRNMLLRELRAHQPDANDRARRRLADLWATVNTSLAESWTVQRLARHLHMSESAVYQQVVACHGMSPMQMVTQLRMERAKDLLLHSNQTLQAVGEAVGYQTAYAFSDAFLRYTGRRPGRFRRPAAD